jgi:membrane protease subunit HflC
METLKKFFKTLVTKMFAHIRTPTSTSRPLGTLALIAVIIAGLALFYTTCTVVVTQGEITIIMRFGKPVRVITEPGLYLKLPYPFHRLKTLDGRLLMLEPRPSEFLTADKKNLILENSICYNISDPILFMKTVRDKNGLEVRLTDLLSSHTGLVLGVRELSDIVNVDSEKLKCEEMNQELTNLMKTEGKELGIEVKQVFIKRVMLPYENTQAVYERMQAERNRIARKYIAEGEEAALKIRSQADKESREMIAVAQRRATIIQGQAEAQAMKIYGETYQKNLEFYNYLRSLEAYKNMFNEQTTIILDEKSPILETLFSGADYEKE